MNDKLLLLVNKCFQFSGTRADPEMCTKCFEKVTLCVSSCKKEEKRCCHLTLLVFIFNHSTHYQTHHLKKHQNSNNLQQLCISFVVTHTERQRRLIAVHSLPHTSQNYEFSQLELSQVVGVVAKK